MDFRARIKRALTGSASTSLVFLGNFEVENQWAIGEVGVPQFEVDMAARTIVNHMDEFALVLGTAGDHVVLKSQPDPDYLDFLGGLGFSLPSVLCPAGEQARHTVTDDALADPTLLAALGELGASGCFLLPHGVSELEEELVRRSGLPLATSSAATCKTVNSKIYSRCAATKLGLRQTDGRTCENLDDLGEAVAWAQDLLDSGKRVVVKDAYGVSGKGVVVVSDGNRLAKLRRMVESGLRRFGDDRIALVIEEWVSKRADLNYQFTIGRDVSVSFDFALEAVTEHGVHRGHRFPANLTRAQQDELIRSVEQVGGLLAADGYAGVVGVDAMIDPEGGIYPIVEINARNNMSTYQAVCCQHLVGDGQVAMARHYALKLTEPLPFSRLDDVLGTSLYNPASMQGLAVNNFATVNACFTGEVPSGGSQDGRLYGVLVAETPQRLAALDTDITAKLRALTEEAGH